MAKLIKNKIIITKKGEKEKIIEKYCKFNLEDQDYKIFFNKIIKAPIEDGLLSYPDWEADLGLRTYLTKINPNNKYYGNKKDKINEQFYQKNTKGILPYHPLDEEEVSKITTSDKEVSLLKLGEKMYNDYIKHGATDLCGWKIRHWGGVCGIAPVAIEKYSLSFSTDMPAIHIAMALSEKNPDIIIKMRYASLVIGENSGYIELKGGKIIYQKKFKNNSKKADENAFKVYPEKKQKFKYNKYLNRYVHISWYQN